MEKQSAIKYKIYQLFLLFIVSSMLGYIYECITTFIRTGILYKDTGFSCLPILPIYGFGVLILYFLLGTPNDMRILHKPILKNNTTGSKVARYILYFVLSMTIASIFELIVGVFFEMAFDTVLWNYESLPLHFTKYVCLQVSILWGIGATSVMSLLFRPLYNLAISIPETKLYKMVNGFLFIWILDIVFNFGYYYTTGAMFSIVHLL